MTTKLLAVCLSAMVLIPLAQFRNRGALLLTDPAYKAETVVCGNLGAVDGIFIKQGKFYLAGEGSGAVQTWSPATGLQTLGDARNGCQSPEDLVVDAEGNLYFTDDDAGGLWHIDPQGKIHLLAGQDQGLISTEGLALAPDGSILVGDGAQHQVFRVTRHGKVSVFLDRAAGITKPESMAFDEAGNLYIADNVDNRIYLLDPQRHVRVLLSQRDGVSSPETIFYRNGSLFINDPKAGKLLQYTPGQPLKTLAVFAGKLKNLQGLYVTESGEIYVTIQDLRRSHGTVVHIAHAR